MLGRDVERLVRGAAEPDRQTFLHRREPLLGAARLDVPAVEIDAPAVEQLTEDGEEFRGLIVALVVGEKHAVGRQFRRVAARHEIDEEPAVADAVDRRRLAREMRLRPDAGPERGEEAQAFGQRRQRGGGRPRVVAMPADRNQHAAEAEPVGGDGDFLEVAEIGGPMAAVAAEIGTIAADGDEPENVERFGGVGHDVGLQSGLRGI